MDSTRVDVADSIRGIGHFFRGLVGELMQRACGVTGIDAKSSKFGRGGE
jgi:hypothetical protein